MGAYHFFWLDRIPPKLNGHCRKFGGGAKRCPKKAMNRISHGMPYVEM